MRPHKFQLAAFGLLAVAALADAICTPTQWESIIFGKVASTDPRSAKVTLFDVSMRYSLDQTNQRAYAYETLHDVLGHAGDIVLQSYDLYQQGFRYVAYPKYQHCEKTPLTGAMPGPCIPDSALQGSYVVAGQPINVYQTTLPPTNDTASIDLNVSLNPILSVPVSEIVTTVARNGVYSFASYTIANLTAGIHDSSVFTPPEYCKTAAFVAQSSRITGSSLFY